ncbi:MAG: isoleucine--tRNA ligase [Thermoproteota archaeon]
MFREEGSELNFPEIEHRILDFWRRTKAFQKRRELNLGKKRWSFMDGPITANNPMGVHHAWGRTYKDVFQRYKAIRGFDLRYQNGFDCQGLWIEVEIEKELGLKTKKDIEAYGIDRFVKRCKQRVLRFAAIQTEQSIRLGYWMDWDDPNLLRELADKLENPNEIISIRTTSGKDISGSVEYIVGVLGRPDLGGSYFTFSDENNYTIWSALKRCYENGWIRKGTDVMPWCPRCSTALSEHEIVTEGYRELKHIALTVRFPLRGRSKEALLIWTTTPWTLSSNVAAAVNPDIVYVKVEFEGEVLYLAKAALDRVLPRGYRVIGEFKGSELEGWLYDGPFDELPAIKKSNVPEVHRVIIWKEVSETEGTGIVHIAPGCGKEDFELGKQYGLPVVAPLNEYGRFIDGFEWLTGMHAYDTPKPIIENLKSKELIFNVEEYIHRYPVCWRCESELIFRLVDEWFILMGSKYNKPLEEITDEEKSRNLRYQIIESAKQVKWIPEFGLKQELDWLLNMSDWMISKKRYWGLALPIWECHECGSFEVIGGKDELRERAVSGWDEFEGHSPHKPWIDKVKIKCKNCGAIISRIADVGNPWLDAGIVSFSTLNYNHDREYWRKWFPADLICESLPGQFRNWFYSMLAMSTIMEKRAPFRTCLGHGTVLAEDGREMHKSWGNAVEFNDAVEKIGADVMRWMYCTTKPENDMLFKYKRAEEIKREFFLILWNVYIFFVTYANLDRWVPRKEEAKLSYLDLWMLSRLQILIEEITSNMERYDIYSATRCIEGFVNDLSTWYLRRSRRRFWKSETDADKEAGYKTLYTCLVTLLKLLAPFTPFLAEHIYQNIVRSVDQKAPESVHHNDWPEPDRSLINEALMSRMELAMKVSSLGRSARSTSGIKLRQPLAKATVVADKEILEQLQDTKELIADELNVKELVLTTKKDDVLDFEVRIIPKLLGAKYGQLMPKIRDALEKVDAASIAKKLIEEKHIEVVVENQKVKLLPEEVQILTKPKEGKSIAEDKNIIVAVDITMTDDLRSEGIARDIVRRIQNERKVAGFAISDTIDLYYKAGPKLTEVFKIHHEYIASETLSVKIEIGDPPEGSHRAEFELEGESLSIGLVIHEKHS